MSEKSTTQNGNGGGGAAAAVSIITADDPTTAHDVTKKRTPDQYTRNFDLNEISPLRGDDGSNKNGETNGHRLLINDQPHQFNIQVIDADDPDGAGAHHQPMSSSKSKNKLKGTYHSILTNLQISEKARLPFLLTIGLAAILLLAIIIMIAFWPRIPYYMKANICVDKECLQASSQVSHFRK